MEFKNENFNFVASKNIQDHHPTVKIDEITRMPNYLRQKFYVYFDSIKSPRDQANAYISDCDKEVRNLEKYTDSFLTYISKIENDINDYSYAKGKVAEYGKRLKAAKEVQVKTNQKIKEKQIELTNLNKILPVCSINELNQQGQDLVQKLEKLKKITNKESAVNKEKKELAIEITEAHKKYKDLLKLLQNTKFPEELPKDVVFVTSLKESAQLDELKAIQLRVTKIKVVLDTELREAESNKDYDRLRLINLLREFISKNLMLFKDTYPDFYGQIEADYSKFSTMDKKIRSLSKWIHNLNRILEVIANYIRVLKKYEMTGVDITITTETDARFQENQILKSLEDIKELISNERRQTGIISEELLRESRKYSKADLEEKIPELNKSLQELQNEVKAGEVEERTAQELISESEGKIKNPPIYIDKTDEVRRIKLLLTKAVSKIGDVKSVIDKIQNKKMQNLTVEEKNIIKNIGLFFGDYQVDILHNYVMRKVTHIDLIAEAYILDDKTVVPFRSNPGKILINTLLAKIRNLPDNKKSILLIDEITPLDGNNLKLLQKEIKDQISSGKVIFASITVPGIEHDDKELHVTEL